MRLRELAGVRVRYGYRRLHILLRPEGWKINAKRVYRLYREEGLWVRTRTLRVRGISHRLFLHRKINQVARIARQLPLEVLAPAEELPVRILHPLRDDGFIPEVMQLLEQEQTDHQPYRLRRSTFCAVTVRKGFLESCPRQSLGELIKRLPRIELLAQRRH